MDALLPPVRCPQELKERLQVLAGQSVTSDLSPHMRAAVELYIEANWTPSLEEAYKRLKPRADE